MSIIVYAESWEGKFRKSTYEAVSYAKNMSEILQQEVKSISVGDISEEELKKLGIYGSSSVESYPNIHILLLVHFPYLFVCIIVLLESCIHSLVTSFCTLN